MPARKQERGPATWAASRTAGEAGVAGWTFWWVGIVGEVGVAGWVPRWVGGRCRLVW